MYWILSVVFTSLLVDSFNNSIAACFGSDNASVCLTHEVAASVGKLPAAVLLSMFDDILLINVSTVQYSTEYQPRALASLASTHVN